MGILIESGDWGCAQISDISALLDNVSRHLTVHCGSLPPQTIHVLPKPNENCPRVLYRSAPTEDFSVWLTCRERHWSQFAYQFAHELCHILQDHDRLKQSSHHWFHESLCELASLIVLRSMSKAWIKNPPFPNWSSYAPQLKKYATAAIRSGNNCLPKGVVFSTWFQSELPNLVVDPLQRTKNGLVAIALLGLFEEEQTGWQSIRHLPADAAASFGAYLAAWKARCPTELGAFVDKVAKKFGTTPTQV